MSPASAHCGSRGHARQGLILAASLVVVGAILRIDWNYLPLAFYAGIVAAWGSMVRNEGIRPSGVLLLRSGLTAIGSLAALCVFLMVLVAVMGAWSLLVTHRLDVNSWWNDFVPNRAHIESPKGHRSTLAVCIAVGSGVGAVAGVAAWYVASRRWAICGAVSFPLLWLTMFWSESFKAGAVAVPTRVPIVGTVDGGLITLYLSTAWVALGGWLGDRSRTRRQIRGTMDGETAAAVSNAK